MAPVGARLLVRQLILTPIYRFLRLLFVIVQRLYWELNGTADQLRRASDPKNYSRSAHVVDIVAFYQFSSLTGTKLDDFIYVHNRFEDPQFVIDNDHVSLLTVDKDYAVFVEAREKGMHLWKAKYNPFIRFAHTTYGKRLIIVPRDVFHRMSESIGDPSARIIFLHNTARCGSTLLTQMFENTGRCVTLSEPLSPNIVSVMCRKYGDNPEMRQLARDVIRWECRPYYSKPSPLAYLIKIAAPAVGAGVLYRSVFPDSVCLFMYRDVLTVAKSLARLFHAYPTSYLMLRLQFIWPGIIPRFYDSILQWGQDFVDLRPKDDLSTFIHSWALSIKDYNEMVERGEETGAVLYDDLVARPADNFRRILEYCKLPVNLLNDALEGLKFDSQRNTPISRSKIGQIRESRLSEESVRAANDIMRKMKLPDVQENVRLERTITC